MAAIITIYPQQSAAVCQPQGSIGHIVLNKHKHNMRKRYFLEADSAADWLEQASFNIATIPVYSVTLRAA